MFDEQLRLYPDASGLVPQHAAHLAFANQLRAIAASVDERCGGLLHLELAENKARGSVGGGGAGAGLGLGIGAWGWGAGAGGA